MTPATVFTKTGIVRIVLVDTKITAEMLKQEKMEWQLYENGSPEQFNIFRFYDSGILYTGIEFNYRVPNHLGITWFSGNGVTKLYATCNPIFIRDLDLMWEDKYNCNGRILKEAA